MSISVPEMIDVEAREGPCYLVPFQPAFSPLVVSWVGDDRELFWLAPKTAAPLTPSKVLAWPGSQGCPLSFCRDGSSQPLGYLEINPMPGEPHHFWLGHCIIDPAHRSIGLGRTMIGLALEAVFARRHGLRTSLVVFPENVSAIRCYRAAGFTNVREQLKYFFTTRRRHAMLQMTIDLQRYRSLRSDLDLR